MIDLSFPAFGDYVPVDHGYALYSAVTRLVPDAHGQAWLGIHPIGASLWPGKLLQLHRYSAVTLRIPPEHAGVFVRLIGETLDVQGYRLTLRAPTMRPITPYTSRPLDSRCVLVRLSQMPRRENPEFGRQTIEVNATATAVRQELERQLADMGLQGEVTICGRRTVTVAGRRLIGFSVRVSGLDDAGSVVLQNKGLGGKRAMGCGIFRPMRGMF